MDLNYFFILDNVWYELQMRTYKMLYSELAVDWAWMIPTLSNLQSAKGDKTDTLVSIQLIVDLMFCMMIWEGLLHMDKIFWAKILRGERKEWGKFTKLSVRISKIAIDTFQKMRLHIRLQTPTHRKVKRFAESSDKLAHPRTTGPPNQSLQYLNYFSMGIIPGSPEIRISTHEEVGPSAFYSN